MSSPLNCFLIIVLVALVLCACEDKTLASLNVVAGEPFPAIVVKSLEGNDVSLDSSSGKAQVINIWATWCGPCRHELPSLQRLKSKLDDKKFDVIGISVDNDDHLVREFLIEQKVSYPNFLDTDSVIVNDVLGVRVYPSTYLVRSDGIIEEIILGWREWDSPELVATISQLYIDKKNNDTD